MSIARRITGIAISVLLIFGIWSSVTHSQDERGRRRLPDEDSSARKGSPARPEPTPPDSPAQPDTPEPPTPQTKPGTMTAEEKLVRDVYARLMRYQSAARDELAARNSLSSEPNDYLTFQLRRIHTGPIAEIYYRPLAEMVTGRSGATINLTPTHLSNGNDPAHAYYAVEWSQPDIDADRDDPTLESASRKLKRAMSTNEEPLYPVDQSYTTNTVGEMLRKGGARYANVEEYTSYEVAVQLNGEQRTYRALVLYHRQNAWDTKKNELANGANALAKQVTAEVLDNITSEMDTVLNDESPRVQSPWNKYVNTSQYAAVIRTIRATKAAGRPLRPADAPIGYLPGDDVVPSKLDMQMLTAAACPTPPPTVASLQATLPSTQNAVTHVAPPDGVFSTTNSSTAFATTSTTDLMAVFQGSGTVTVTAMGVSPSNIASQLKWSMQRDPTDQIDFGLPNLVGTGPSVGFQPTLAGNFILICYYDSNGNGSYDSGEELKVLRWASVRTTFVSDSSFFHAQTMFTGSPNGVNTVNAMNLQADVVLEGGGADALIGVDRVTLGNVGNLWQPDNFVVNYPVPNPAPPAPGNVSGTESENPGGLGASPPGGPIPMVDTSRVAVNAQPTGGITAFRLHSNNNSLGAGPGGLGQIRRVVSDDAPGFTWDYNHPTTQNPWGATVNGNAFREFIVGFSTSFPQNYVVIAYGEYSVVANGANSGGTWASGSGAAVNGTAFTSRVSANFTPQVGNASGVQVLGLSFVRQVDMDHAP